MCEQLIKGRYRIDPVNFNCGMRSKISIDGVNMCMQHGGMVAIEKLLTNEIKGS